MARGLSLVLERDKPITTEDLYNLEHGILIYDVDKVASFFATCVPIKVIVLCRRE